MPEAPGSRSTCDVPVHDVALWTNSRVRGTLLDALNFLTGDAWDIECEVRPLDGQEFGAGA